MKETLNGNPALPVLIESTHFSVQYSFLKEIEADENKTLFLSPGKQPRPLQSIKRLIISLLYEENISLNQWGTFFEEGGDTHGFIAFCRDELGIGMPENSSYYTDKPGLLGEKEWHLLADHLRPAFEKKKYLVIFNWGALDHLTQYFIETFYKDIPLMLIIFSDQPLAFEHQSYLPELKTKEKKPPETSLFDIWGPAVPKKIASTVPAGNEGYSFGEYTLFFSGGSLNDAKAGSSILSAVKNEKQGYYDWHDLYSLQKGQFDSATRHQYLKKMKKKLDSSLNLDASIFIHLELAALASDESERLLLYTRGLLPLYDAIQSWEKGEEAVHSFSPDLLSPRERTYLLYYKYYFEVKLQGGEDNGPKIKELFDLCRKEKWAPEYYDILSLLCYIAYMNSDYDTVQKKAQLLLDSSFEPRNPARDVEALNLLGAVEQNRGDPKSALRFYEKAYGIAEKNRLVYRKIMMNSNIGLCYTEMSQPDKALQYLKEALYGALRSNIKMVLGNAYGNIGLVYKINEEHQSALDYFTKALNIFISIQYKRGMYIAYESLASSYYLLGDGKSALLYYAALEKMLKEWGEKRLLASAWANFGRVWLHLRYNGKKAAQYLTQSIETAIDIGVWDWADEIPYLMDAWLLENHTDKAKEAFQFVRPHWDDEVISDELRDSIKLRLLCIKALEQGTHAKEELLKETEKLSENDSLFWDYQFMLQMLFDASTLPLKTLQAHFDQNPSPESRYRSYLLKKKKET
jgi:tetratricopeptide (TPR) repeat protein